MWKNFGKYFFPLAFSLGRTGRNYDQGLRTFTEKSSEPMQSNLLKSELVTLRQVRFPVSSLLNLSFTTSSCSPSKRYTQLQNPFWPALSALNRIYTPRRPGKGVGFSDRYCRKITRSIEGWTPVNRKAAKVILRVDDGSMVCEDRYRPFFGLPLNCI